MKRSLLALALTAALPFAAQAGELSYNYVEGGYVNTDIDGAPTLDGWTLGGSAALGSSFHVFGNYATQEFNNTNIDIDTWRLGFGYNHALTDRADLIARVAYENADAGGGLDLDAYSAEIGVRGLLAPQFEGWALAGYVDGDDVDGEFYGKLGGQFKFNQTWGLVGEVTVADDATTYFVGPRITF